jgi:sugar phosphate isomerase/epimerase
MKSSFLLSRRQALKTAALAAAGVWARGVLGAPGGATVLQLGVASYSLARLSPEEVIAALKKINIRNVSLYKTHCPWGGTADQCRAAAQKFRDAGLTVTGSGVINLPNDEGALRKAFDNARAAGLPTMICKPAKDAFPLVEKFVKEYDIRLAVHNHGPEDNVYPSPYDAWNAVQPYDRRIGLCIDVGHAARAGADPVEAFRKCRERLYDVHLKDSLAMPGALRDIPTEVGKGHLDIKGMIAALVEIKYPHVVAFEYEKQSEDPVAGLAESVSYVRKLLG